MSGVPESDLSILAAYSMAMIAAMSFIFSNMVEVFDIKEISGRQIKRYSVKRYKSVSADCTRWMLRFGGVAFLISLLGLIFIGLVRLITKEVYFSSECIKFSCHFLMIVAALFATVLVNAWLLTRQEKFSSAGK